MNRGLRSQMSALFITVFIDMLSFGIVIPDLQLKTESLGAYGWVSGLVLAAFSIAQLIAAPLAGRISDKYGRKPILFIGAVLNTLSFGIYAFSRSLPMLTAARAIGGLGASNLAAAYAYAADLSSDEDRSKSMGMLGAAFGMGFVLGPFVGGVIARQAGSTALGLVSAAICVINCIWIWLRLHERKSGLRTQAAVLSLKALKAAISLPGMFALLLLYFVYNFGFANLESTFVTFAQKRYGWDQQDSGMFLGYVGLMLALTQGVLLSPLQKRFGERNLVRVGLLLVAPALAMIPFLHSVSTLLINATVLSFGSGISTPAIAGLISRTASAQLQGGIFGITQSLGACARIAGPIAGRSALSYSLYLPYLVAGGIVLIPAFMAWFVIGQPAARQDL